MHWIDLVIIGFIALNVFSALRTGLIRQVVTLASVIAGGVVAANLYERLAANIDFLVADPLPRQLIAFGAIFAGFAVLGQIVAQLLRSVASVLLLGPLDRLGGALFGFVQAVVMAEFALFAVTAFPAIPGLTQALDQSALAPVFLGWLPLFERLLPPDFRAAIEAYGHGGLPSLPLPLPGGGTGRP